LFKPSHRQPFGPGWATSVGRPARRRRRHHHALVATGVGIAALILLMMILLALAPGAKAGPQAAMGAAPAPLTAVLGP
jgi:hypothetical protein